MSYTVAGLKIFSLVQEISELVTKGWPLILLTHVQARIMIEIIKLDFNASVAK